MRIVFSDTIAEANNKLRITINHNICIVTDKQKLAVVLSLCDLSCQNVNLFVIEVFFWLVN